MRSHVNRSRALSAILAAGISLSGCGALIFRNPQTILVVSNVKDAQVPGVGRLPMTLQLDRTKNHVLEVQAPGYEPRSVVVRSELSWWRILVSVVLNGGHGIFTLWISTVVGCTIDAAAGAWQGLDDEVLVELEPSRGPEAPK